MQSPCHDTKHGRAEEQHPDAGLEQASGQLPVHLSEFLSKPSKLISELSEVLSKLSELLPGSIAVWFDASVRRPYLTSLATCAEIRLDGRT